jgi:hypothetical protein
MDRPWWSILSPNDPTLPVVLATGISGLIEANMFTQVFIKQGNNIPEPLNECNNYFQKYITLFLYL